MSERCPDCNGEMVKQALAEEDPFGRPQLLENPYYKCLRCGNEYTSDSIEGDILDWD